VRTMFSSVPALSLWYIHYLLNWCSIPIPVRWLIETAPWSPTGCIFRTASVPWRSSAYFSEDEVGLILDGAVALARRQFQGFPVQDGDVAAGVPDDAGLLKDAGRDRHA
jgi:hypothetical protein